MTADDRVLRTIPAVDRLSRTSEAQAMTAQYGRGITTTCIRAVLAAVRGSVSSGETVPPEAMLLQRVRTALEALHGPRIRPVLNLSGTVQHTNLGRALLAPEAAAAALRAATGTKSSSL